MRYLLGHVLAMSGRAVRVTVLEYEGESGRVVKGAGETVWLPLSTVKAGKIEYYEDVEFEVKKGIMEDKGLV